MARIGMVEYINALPFHLPYKLGELKTEHTFTFSVPTALKSQNFDIVLSSSTHYERLMPYCIAAEKEILSVNLYTRGDLSKIAITSHSSASVALLKVLCAHFWNKNPEFAPYIKGEEYDAFLLIGDEALEKQTVPGYQTIDLAKAWFEATDHPFVFAVASSKEPVHDDPFAEALEWSAHNEERLLEAAHAQTNLPKTLLSRYYDLCTYHLGDRELEGLKHFQRLYADVSKICT